MGQFPAWIDRLPARSEPLPGWVNRLPSRPVPEWVNRLPARRGGRVRALDTHRMLEEGLAEVARIEEGRQRRWDANRVARERAMEVYERANAEYAARQAGAPPVRVAASLAWWHRPPPLDVW